MTSLKPLDTFISNSIQLLEANPSQTLVSLSYVNKNKSTKVIFKTHNPHLGLHYRFKTKRLKDVSRFLSSLGPRGVNITTGKIEKNTTKTKNKDTVGMACLMVNTNVKQYIPEKLQVISAVSSKSKKNKKRGSKR